MDESPRERGWSAGDNSYVVSLAFEARHISTGRLLLLCLSNVTGQIAKKRR